MRVFVCVCYPCWLSAWLLMSINIGLDVMRLQSCRLHHSRLLLIYTSNSSAGIFLCRAYLILGFLCGGACGVRKWFIEAWKGRTVSILSMVIYGSGEGRLLSDTFMNRRQLSRSSLLTRVLVWQHCAEVYPNDRTCSFLCCCQSVVHENLENIYTVMF